MDDRKANVHPTFKRHVDFRTFYALGLAVAAFFVLAWFLTPGMVDSGKVSAGNPEPDAAQISRANFDFALNLRTAHDYAVFARRGVRDNGNTEVNGDAGSFVRNGFDGLLGGRVHGRMIDPGNLQGRDLRQADQDLSRAYSAMKQLPCGSTFDNGNLGDRSLDAGVYCMGDATIDGTLTLNAGGNQNAVFVFIVGGNLGTRNGSRVALTNGARWGNVYFVTEGLTSIASNSRIDGSIVSKRDVTIGGGTLITGKTYSVSGRIETADAQLGPGTGVIEVCKTLRAGSPPLTQPFTFTIGATTVSVTVGNCSGPITVNAGNNIMVTEGQQTNVAVSSITTNLNNALLVNADLPNRTATVQVRAGGVDVETIVTFENTSTQTGSLEICKFADIVEGQSAIDVAGTFNFTVSGVPGTFAVAVGQCTQPITITTNVTTGSPFDVVVTELGRVGFQLERVNTIPATRLQNVVLGTPPGGGMATVRLIAGDPSNQVVVNFFNRAAASSLKICKIAGPGIPNGTIFRFNVTGTGPNTTLPTFPPGVPVNITNFDVAAGPAPFGNCRFLPATFVVGTPITVTELPGTFGGGTPSPGEVRVSRIRYFGLGTAATNTTARTATFIARPEQQAVEFTNFVFNQAVLKVCKTVAAGSTLIPRSFTFDLAMVDPNGLFVDFPIAPVTVSVTAAGTTCTFAQGPFTPTGTVPPIGTFNLNSQVTVTERAQTGVSVTAISSPTNNTLTGTNLANRTSTISITNAFNPNNLFNEIAFTNVASTGPALQAVRFDFDGDGKADPSIFTPASFTWKYLASGNGGQLRSVTFGEATDRPVPADYDGDGKYDQAVYRNGTWYILGSTNVYQVFNWGEVGDIPVVADYDGDGKADRAVFRPSTGTWWVNMTRDGWNVFQYGVSTDRVMAYDFDGDGKADPTVFRNGQWFIRGTQMGFAIYNFGIAGDIPTVADFDGDRKADVAVYRGGTWYVLGSAGAYRVYSHGLASDRPVAADYDGDGKADLAVFRPSEGNWYIRRSSSSSDLGEMQILTLGSSSDITLPGQ